MKKVFVVLILTFSVLQSTAFARQATAPAQQPRRPDASCKGVSIPLHYGVLDASGKPDQRYGAPPSNMTHDLIAAEAPLPKGAEPSRRSVGSQMRGPLAGTKYLKTGVAEYEASGSVKALENWYRSAFAACDYSLYLDEALKGTFRELLYVPPAFDSLRLSVAVQRISKAKTLVVYYASALSMPPRPATTLVPTRATSVRVTYVLPNNRHEYRVTLRDSRSLNTIANAVDGPATVYAISFHSCPAQHGFASLQFMAGGKVLLTVSVIPSCEMFWSGSKAFHDPSNTLWLATGAQLYRHCFLTKSCKEVKS